MSKRQPDIIARGPEIIPQDTDSWQYEAYLQGKRSFDHVLPGQRFPEGAGQEELDAIAGKRPGTIGKIAIAYPAPAAAAPDQPETIAA